MQPCLCLEIGIIIWFTLPVLVRDKHINVCQLLKMVLGLLLRLQVLVVIMVTLFVGHLWYFLEPSN